MHKFRSKELNKIISFNLNTSFNSFSFGSSDDIAEDIVELDKVKFTVKLPADTVSIVMVMNENGTIENVYSKLYEQDTVDIYVLSDAIFNLYVVSKDYDDGYVVKSAAITIGPGGEFDCGEIAHGTPITISQYSLSIDSSKKNTFDASTMFDAPELDLSEDNAKRKKVPNENDETQWYPYVGNYSGGTPQWEQARDYDYLEQFFILLKKRAVLARMRDAWYYSHPSRVNSINADSEMRCNFGDGVYETVGTVFDYTLPYGWGTRARRFILSSIEALNSFAAAYRWYINLSDDDNRRVLLADFATISGDTDILASIGEKMPDSWDVHRAKKSHRLIELYDLNLTPMHFIEDSFRNTQFSSWPHKYSQLDGNPTCFLYPETNQDFPRHSDEYGDDNAKIASHLAAMSRTYMTNSQGYRKWLNDASDDHYDDKHDSKFYKDYTSSGGGAYTGYKHPGWLINYIPAQVFWAKLHGIPKISGDQDDDVSGVPGNRFESGRYHECSARYHDTYEYFKGQVTPLSQDVRDINGAPFVEYYMLLPDGNLYHPWATVWGKARDLAIRSLEIRQLLDDEIKNIDDEYLVLQTDLMRNAGQSSEQTSGLPIATIGSLVRDLETNSTYLVTHVGSSS